MTSEGLPVAGWYADPRNAAAMRWWDGRSWTDYVAASPAEPLVDHYRSRDSLSWVAAAFIGIWCLVGVVVGVDAFANADIQATPLTSSHPLDGSILFGASAVATAIWLVSLNLLIPGLITGIVAVARRGHHRVARAIALPVVVIGGCMAQFATLGLDSGDSGTSFVDDGRLAALIFALVALLVAGATLKLLDLRIGRQTRRPR